MALKKVEKKVSLNIKINEDLDKRLKRARKVAREKGKIFNVSKTVEDYLLKELKKVEKQLEINLSIKEEESQTTIFDESEEIKVEKEEEIKQKR